jgi:formylglycine-generating enzyme required for sulfatase activity
MHGNVWEWCEDCWNGSYEDAPTDGSAWLRGDRSKRVVRGGAHNSGPRNLRSATRHWFEPAAR